jgi:AcrR family transcriptional regulator
VRAVARRAPPEPAPRPPRKRRTPEAAREAILLAADQLFAADGPEHVGLAQIAAAAGVTHGLVTHYFGTFAGLVREVFRRRNRLAAATVLEQVMAARETGDVTGLGRFAVDYVSDEVRARLFLWLRTHEPPRAPEGEPKNPLLRALVDAIEHALPALQQRHAVPAMSRERIELLVLLTLAAGHGWAIGKQAWLRGLGRDPGPEVDEAFRSLLLSAIHKLTRDD